MAEITVPPTCSPSPQTASTNSSGKVHSTSATTVRSLPWPSMLQCGISTSPVVTKNSPARSARQIRAPVGEARHAVELDVVHVEVAVEVVVGKLLVGVDLADHVFGTAPVVHVVERAEAPHLAESFLRQVHRHRLEGRSQAIVGCGSSRHRGSCQGNRSSPSCAGGSARPMRPRASSSRRHLRRSRCGRPAVASGRSSTSGWSLPRTSVQ